MVLLDEGPFSDPLGIRQTDAAVERRVADEPERCPAVGVRVGLVGDVNLPRPTRLDISARSVRTELQVYVAGRPWASTWSSQITVVVVEPQRLRDSVRLRRPFANPGLDLLPDLGQRLGHDSASLPMARIWSTANCSISPAWIDPDGQFFHPRFCALTQT